jgi:selenide,water dikinase
MERLNDVAARLALEHGATAGTDVTGFGFAGHALNIARASAVGLRVEFARLPVWEAFYPLVRRGVTTGSTAANRRHAGELVEIRAELDAAERELLFDPQTSGGLLVTVPAETAETMLRGLLAAGLRAADVGEVVAGPVRLVVE